MSAALLPGQRLREARERAGLTEAEAARRLHLSTSFVRALEADDYDRLPEPAFIKGYLRNYARLLQLPPDDLANLFAQMIAEDAPAAPPVRAVDQPLAGSIRRWSFYLAGALVAGLLVWAGAGTRDSEPTAPSGPAGVPATEQGPAGAEDVPPVPVEEGGAATLDQEPDVQVAAEEEPVAGPDRLVVELNDSCWLKVEDDAGEQVYAGQKPAGSRLVAEGRAPFRITLGNAAAVSSIHVNDIAVSVPAAEPGRVRTLRAP